MSADIESIALEKMCISGTFALQLDESTDISGCAQLLANVHFVDGDAIRENVRLCKALSEETKGFVSHVKERHPDAIVMHFFFFFFLQREALVAKTLPADLAYVLEDVAHTINLKARPQKAAYLHLCVRKCERSIKSYCSTEVRWLSRGRVLAHVYELREELKVVFFTNETCNDAKLLASDEWCARLAFMADIFQHLNELNTRMQGRNENLLTNMDKINEFRSKVQLWQQHVESTNLGLFPLTQKWQGVNTAALCETIGKHLKTLKSRSCRFIFLHPPLIALTGLGTHL